MRIFTFKGGAYPHEQKEFSCNSEITNAFPSTKQVTIPITMGGSQNECLVKVGDHVTKGQLIAKSDKYISAFVHSSVSGTVKKIMPHLTAGNFEVPSVTIEADGSDECTYMSVLDPFSCSKSDAINRVKEAGIVGMGGAVFPTHVKLSPPDDTKIEYVILNASECEPYLTVDYRLMKEECQKVIDGLTIEMHILEAKGIIALENNKLDLVPILKEEIAKTKFANDIEIKILKTKYPQGSEKTIIKAILNREVPHAGIPAYVGCVVSNVGTVYAISEAFRIGKPVIDRIVTVSGGACENPMNIRVPIGTNVGDLIPEVIHLKPGKIVKILSGGPMMGTSMTNAMFPIAKGTSDVLFLTKEETYLVDESPCIGCGRCVEGCPMRLTPVMMVRSLKANDYDAALKFGLTDCIECGCCTYVCPANVRLVQRFKLGKNALREIEENKKLKESMEENNG